MAVWTLWNQTGGGSLASDTSSYTLGVEFHVTQPGCTLTGIWWYSASGAGALPGTIALYTVTGTTLVTSNTASWSGAAGSGWVRASFTSPPSLTSGTNYKACVFLQNNGSVNFYSSTVNYWSSGAGGSGVTSGPITAPNNAGASPSQDSYNAGTSLAYPSTASGNASNYWIDPEVTAPAAGGSGPPVVPGRTWLRRFRRAAVPPPPPPFIATVTPAAGLATATGAAAVATPPSPSAGNFVPGDAVPAQAEPGHPLVTGGLVVAIGPSLSAATFQALPGRTWLRMFRRVQQQFPASAAAAPSASASAGLATGTGAALRPVASAGANVTVATATGAALTAAAEVDAASTTTAPGTGAALSPVASAGANAGLATGTGAAQQPVPSVAVNAGLATGTGAALQPSVQVGGNVNANPGVATGTGTAQQPVPSVAVNAGVATGTGAALAVGHGSPAGLATGTGAALTPALTAAANAAAATALAAALSPVADVVEPFTVGTLTAMTAPGAASGGTLTASDQRTGGPGG